MAYVIFCLAVLGLARTGFAQVSAFETTLYPFPQTSFTCHGRRPGYYADVDTGCKSYHVCDGISHFTYVCPRRTLFQQKMRICDHAYKVTCSESSFSDDDYYPQGSIDGIPVEDSEENNLNKEYYRDFGNRNSTQYIPIAITKPTESVQTISFAPTKQNKIISSIRITAFPTTTTTAAAATTTAIPTATTTTSRPITAAEATATKAEALSSSTAAVTRTLEASSSASPTTLGSLLGLPPKKFLKFTLKDFRSLFFIPEFDNNSVIAKPDREVVVDITGSDLMQFKEEAKVQGSSSLACPGFCNPKYFLPGTCHPCLMIK